MAVKKTEPYVASDNDELLRRSNARLDSELQPDPELAEGPAMGGRVALFAIAIVAILGAVFYGLNNPSVTPQPESTAQTTTTPPSTTATAPTPAPGQTTGSATTPVTPPTSQPGNSATDSGTASTPSMTPAPSPSSGGTMQSDRLRTTKRIFSRSA